MSIRVKLKSQMPNTKQITRLYKKILAASRSSKTSGGGDGSKNTTSNRNMINWNLPEWAIIKFPPRPYYFLNSFDSPFIFRKYMNCLILVDYIIITIVLHSRSLSLSLAPLSFSSCFIYFLSIRRHSAIFWTWTDLSTSTSSISIQRKWFWFR